MSNGYEIKCSITALCPSCGKELPPNSYMTRGKITGHPFERDFPEERTHRYVFVTPCLDCFVHKNLVTHCHDAIAEKNSGLGDAIEALKEWDALIKHQYNGTREGMTDLACIAQRTPEVITKAEKAFRLNHLLE